MGPRSGWDADVIIIGAGAAGIAAARRLSRQGKSLLLLEARSRTGGRAVTQALAGAPVDLGAHWIHAARRNPLVGLAHELGLEVSRAYYRFRAIKDRRPLSLLARHGLYDAWEKTEDRILAAAARAEKTGRDLSIAEAAGNAGPWTSAAMFMHGCYDCGADPALISTIDFARVDDERDMLVAGGLGALVARLGEGLPVTFDADIARIEEELAALRLTARDGRSWRARQVILTVPLMLLQAGAIALPQSAGAWLDAASAFHAATYEHVVLQAATPPWSHRHDQMVYSIAGADSAVIFAHMEGSDLHYLDVVAAPGRALAAMGDEAGRSAAAALLTRHFGPCPDVTVLTVTQWATDPLALGAWALARPGGADRREALRQPCGRLVYAGEACSRTQWGTVGGAWLEGERAAGQLLAAGG